MDSDEAPQPIKGVVIISLPPPDNPSLGKTITAFTFSNAPQSQTHHQQQNHQNNHQRAPLPPENPPSQLSFSNSGAFLVTPRKLLGFLGISLFALALYSSVSSQPLRESRRSEDDHGPTSFLFPLYPKSRTPQINVKLKLGRLVGIDKGDMISSIEDARESHMKLFASIPKVDSTSILPVRGNIHPDGYGWILLLSLIASFKLYYESWRGESAFFFFFFLGIK
jgi:hypothetical protein